MKDKDIRAAKKKKFIELPKYPGGKNAFKEFVSQNLIYPEEALRKGVEGIVYAEYEVDNLGNVIDVRIKKGIGSGCDEETIRILNLLEYEPVHNRGLRVKSKMKARILFKLPVTPSVDQVQSVNINYTITEKKDNQKEPNKSYSYTINIG